MCLPVKPCWGVLLIRWAMLSTVWVRLSLMSGDRLNSRQPASLNRQPIDQSLHTGITAIDAMTPIGRGQRELIIGDRQTGKTALAIDAIINQRGKNVSCIYVAIGQKMSTVASVVNILQAKSAMEYTTVVVAQRQCDGIFAVHCTLRRLRHG